jgi:TonB-linked SusC/RagA family outer membrane protein
MKKNYENGCFCGKRSLQKFLLVMKFTFLMILLTALQSFGSVYSQTTKLSVNLQNATLTDVFTEIEKQSEFRFLYNNDLLENKNQGTVNFVDKTVEEILDLILAGTGSKYSVLSNNLIVISPVEITSPQNGVTGRVTSANGESLPGVTVLVKGTAQGTVTDVDGNYSIGNIPENAILVFSFVGMQTQEIAVENQSQIDVVLRDETIGLEEVVAIGYGVQKRATLTGSIGSVRADELTQRPAANTTELLQGQISGLITRQSSGLPGADGTTLNIRGFGSPLVIVDGIQTALAQVDPNDIESISVLKDASAAVYGARAGNGVILVTTKRGTEKPSQITYHGSVSVTQPTFLAEQVSAREWAEMLDESGLNPDNYGPNHVHYDPDSKTLINQVDGSIYEGYNWAKAIYRSWTPQYQHNLSARGGNEKIRYFVSGGFTDQESNFKSGDYDFNRYNIRSNIDASITDDLAVSVDFSYHTTLLDKANFDVSDVFNNINSARPVYPYVHEADPSRAAYSGGARTPYYKTFKDYSGFIEERGNVLRGIMELRYSFPMIQGLEAKARLNYEDIFSWNKNVNKPFAVWDYDALAAANGQDPWIQQGVESQNLMSVYSDRINRLLPLVTLEYSKIFNDHNFKGMIVSETWTTKKTTLQGDRKDVLSFEAPFLNYASQEGKDNSETLHKTARSSVIGRLNYDYMGKYLLEVAMRADASAEYPPEGRWGYFPSVSAGWRISEETFMKDNYNALNNLKLRASYGVLGNDAVSSFDYLTGFNITDNYYIFGATPAPVISSAGLANPDITWETMKISNIGLDGIFWDGLFGFEIDAFYRLRENILATPQTQVPSTFGASLPQVNMNKRDNRGFEITFTHVNKIGDVTYNLAPMFSWSRGKFVKLDENKLPVTNDLDEETREFNRLWNERYVDEGQWDDRYWGFISDGFFMSQEEIDEHLIDQDQNGNQTLRVGDIRYKDLNGDNYIDWRDQQVIGKSGLPKIMYSLNMGAQYKGLSVHTLWQGAADYTVTFTDRAAAPFHSEGIPLKEHYEYRAITDTDANGNEYITNPNDFKLPPVTQNGRTANNTRASDFWTFNGRFLRLKNINVSYTLPQKVITNTGINNCVLYLSGTNVLTISNLGIWKKSFDPEIPVVNNRQYPPVKTLTLGLKLTI